MADMNFLINAIDLDHNGIISSKQEIKKAESFGINAQMGDNIAKLVEKSSKINLQDKLQQIDQTQTVDNKNIEEILKKRKFSAIG
ncbi:MAG: hypothetical protein MJ237_01250 [bacterium]|nr:hypothetical protein [bacterium]